MLNSKKNNISVANTIIGEEVIIESGLFKGSGTIRIDGKYYGEMDIDGSVIIGEKGYVKGNIRAKHLIVAGCLDGDVVCQNEIHLAQTANISGNITSLVIVVDEGASFNGHCNMAKKSGDFEVVDIKERVTKSVV